MQGRQQPGASVRRVKIRNTGSLCADGSNQCTDQAVAPEQCGAGRCRGRTGQQCLFQRREQGHVIGSGVQRPDDRNHEQWPEISESGYREPGRGHQHAREQQQMTCGVAVSDETHAECHQTGTHKRRGDQQADLPGAISE